MDNLYFVTVAQLRYDGEVFALLEAKGIDENLLSTIIHNYGNSANSIKIERIERKEDI